MAIIPLAIPRFARRVAFGALALTGACALAQQFTFAEPDVALSAVRVTGLDLAGGSLEIVLDVHNPNAYRIQGRQIAAEVELEDVRFGEVARDTPWALPAQADTSLALRLEFGWAAVGAAARSLLDRRAVGYTLTGRVLVGTPVDERWVSLSRSGEVPLERVLR
jgi:LEA14-like dessication related protein